MISYIEVAPYKQSADVKNSITIKIIFWRQDLHFDCYVNHKGLRNNHLLHEDCIFSSKRKKDILSMTQLQLHLMSIMFSVVVWSKRKHTSFVPVPVILCNEITDQIFWRDPRSERNHGCVLEENTSFFPFSILQRSYRSDFLQRSPWKNS